MRSTSPAAINARFIERLPCERNGTSDSSLSRATTSTASPLATLASGQSRGASSVVDTTVAGRLRILVTHASRTDSRCSRPATARMPDRCWLRRPFAGRRGRGRGGGRGSLGALLAPVAGPVAAGGAEAVEAGEDAEGVGSAHAPLLGWMTTAEVQTGNHGETDRRARTPEPGAPRTRPPDLTRPRPSPVCVGESERERSGRCARILKREPKLACFSLLRTRAVATAFGLSPKVHKRRQLAVVSDRLSSTRRTVRRYFGGDPLGKLRVWAQAVPRCQGLLATGSCQCRA